MVIHHRDRLHLKNVAFFATPTMAASGAFNRELSFRAIDVDVEAQAFGVGLDAIGEQSFIFV